MPDPQPPENSKEVNLEQTSVVEGPKTVVSDPGATIESKHRVITLDQIGDSEAIKSKPEDESITPKIDSNFKSISFIHKTRRYIAFILLGFLGFTVLSTLIFIPIGKAIFISNDPKKDKDVEKILDKDTINLIWTSQVTLLGTVLGFYFGSKSNSRDDD